MHAEGLLVAARVDDPVAAGAGDTGHGGAVADLVPESVGEGLEVALGPVAARRVGGGIRADPAGRGEQLLGGRVDDLAPGREQPDMGPLADGAGRARAGLQDQGFQTAFDEMGGGGQTDGAGADDYNGQPAGGEHAVNGRSH